MSRYSVLTPKGVQKSPRYHSPTLALEKIRITTVSKLPPTARAAIPQPVVDDELPIQVNQTPLSRREKLAS